MGRVQKEFYCILKNVRYATPHLRSSGDVGLLLLLFPYSDYLLFMVRFVLLATVSVSMCRLSLPFCVFTKWADALMFGLCHSSNAGLQRHRVPFST
jgi:hypothetical protein